MESVHDTPAPPESLSADQPQANKDVMRRVVLIVLSAMLFFGLAGIFSNNFLFDRNAVFRTGDPNVTEMKVLGVVMDSLSETPAVFLYSEKEEIFLPIWIGANEAVAIQAELSGVKSPRPLTNDLLKDVIEKLDATLEKMVITKVQDDTYYSLLYIKTKNGLLEIDARPSDALGLSIRFKCPIWVNDEIVKKYGMSSQDAAKKRLEKSKKI
jgi:bifunctional DNase/RNase